MDLKRIVLMFGGVLVLALAVVHLRTSHMQAMYRMADMMGQERQLRQELWQQRARLSGALECPLVVKERLEEVLAARKHKGERSDL